jgi:hypothetical protein
MSTNKQHWIIRVGDGNNFKNSVYPFWGVNKGKNGALRSVVKKIQPGDILWFLTSKKFGGQIIGMSEYCNFYDKNDEPLIKINTKTNSDQNWTGNDSWDLQLQYCNLYNTEKQNIKGCIQCAGTILKYNTFKDKINSDLYEHYTNFKFYAEPKKLKPIN